jgi:hypothetical protein
LALFVQYGDDASLQLFPRATSIFVGNLFALAGFKSDKASRPPVGASLHLPSPTSCCFIRAEAVWISPGM